jgi:tripartite tricarboxylate transporter TctB family protein
LFIASRIYGYSWLIHPGVIVIGLIIAAGLLYPYLQERFKRPSESESDPKQQKFAASVKTEPVPLRSRYARGLFAFFFVGIFGYVVYQAQFGFGAFEPRAALFPWVIGLPSLLLAYYVFMRECLQTTRKLKVEEALYSEPVVHPVIARKRTISIASWIIGFFVAIWLLGFTAASAAATFLYLKLGAREKWPITLGLTLASWLFFYGFFDYGLQIPFPDGTLFEWVNVGIPAVRNIFLASG